LALVVLYCCASPAPAGPLYGYALGVSLDNQVVPGSVVTITAVLRNTGDSAITFAPSFPGGPPSAQGGSLPFGNVGVAPFGGTGWPVGNDFLSQFAGATVAPGGELAFTPGVFRVPADIPLGTTANVGVNLGIDFTDAVEGNLVGMSGPLFDYGSFNNAPVLAFTAAGAPSASPLTFFDGLVVDTSTGQVLSGPAGPTTHPPAAPAPPSIVLAGAGAVCGVGYARRRRPR
jgi:hypothetical protein